MKHLLFVLLLALTLGTVLAEEAMYPTVVGQLSTNVLLSGHGTISGLKTGEEVKFQTLTFQESEYQKLSNVREELYINDKIVTPKYILDEFSNKYVSFIIKENGDFTYVLSADINTTALATKIQDYSLTNTTSDEIKQFLNSTEKVESDSTEIKTLEKNKLLTNSFLDSLNTTILWVNDYVEYAQGSDFQYYYLQQKSAIDTLLNKKGVCDEFANLAAAILRAKGIPTRMAIGITYDGSEWGNHAWIEEYHSSAGWIPSDPTFREAGFVDATHIRMGSFADVTQSLAKAYYPSTANVTFDTQSTLPQIKVLSKNYFDTVDISTTATEIKTNEWNEIIIKITNKTNSAILVPVKVGGVNSNNFGIVACLSGKEECLIVGQTKQSILLQPKETKNIKFKFFPNINLASNQKIETEITFYTLSAPYKKKITILAGKGEDNSGVEVKDVSPIATDGKMNLQITLINYSTQNQNADINIMHNQIVDLSTESLPPLSIKTVDREFDSNSNDAFNMTITTNAQTYQQTFTQTEQTIIIIPKEPVKETVVKQIIQTTSQKNMMDTIAENPIILLVALVSGVAVLLFGLFLVNKHYV
ncbi:MAG: transglutaminase-like domain-containing protein [archaeon]|jgi:transglutaminase-like putative cysteine protease